MDLFLDNRPLLISYCGPGLHGHQGKRHYTILILHPDHLQTLADADHVRRALKVFPSYASLTYE